MSGQENDRQRLFFLGENFLQIQSTGARHLEIEDKTAAALLAGGEGKLSRRRVGVHVITGRIKQARERFSERIVVVNDIHDWLVGGGSHHAKAAAGEPRGRSNRRVAPPSSLFSAKIAPPWASTIERAMANPRPIPFCLVV